MISKVSSAKLTARPAIAIAVNEAIAPVIQTAARKVVARSVLCDDILPLDPFGGLPPCGCSGPLLMRLERRAVREHFCNLPDKRIDALPHLEGKATGLGAGEPDMLGKMRRNEGGLCLVRADQLSGEPDHSHSMVPGGFEVMS